MTGTESAARHGCSHGRAEIPTGGGSKQMIGDFGRGCKWMWAIYTLTALAVTVSEVMGW